MHWEMNGNHAPLIWFDKSDFVETLDHRSELTPSGAIIPLILSLSKEMSAIMHQATVSAYLGIDHKAVASMPQPSGCGTGRSGGPLDGP